MKSLIILLGNQYVSIGQRLEVQFYGKPRQLLVTAVTGSYNSLKDPISSTQFKDQLASCDSTNSNLANKLKALNIDDGTPKDTKQALPCDNDDNLSSREDVTSSHQPNGFKSCEEDLERNETKGQITLNMEHRSESCQLSELEQNQHGSQSVFYYISPEETHLTIHPHGNHQNERSKSRRKVTFESIGGLQKQVALVREMIELPLKHPEMFTNYGK